KKKSNMKYKIIPAILEKDQEKLEEKLKKVIPFSRFIQVDIADQNFSKEIVLPSPEIFEKYSKDTNLELHIMTENPIVFFNNFRHVGFKRFIGQVELMPNREEFLEEVTKHGGKAFLGVDIDTELDGILNKKLLRHGLKGVTILTVKAGMSGQEFQENAAPKIEQLRSFFKDLIEIEVDGGINTRTISYARDRGADDFCVNSYIFKSEDPFLSYKILEKKVNNPEN
ncbi:hypothetical protein M1349_02455, partial [Patescibacteria group bacterium]|nr:hypothetical protein [Patescibacteria group bacterium]